MPEVASDGFTNASTHEDVGGARVAGRLCAVRGVGDMGPGQLRSVRCPLVPGTWLANGWVDWNRCKE